MKAEDFTASEEPFNITVQDDFPVTAHTDS